MVKVNVLSSTQQREKRKPESNINGRNFEEEKVDARRERRDLILMEEEEDELISREWRERKARKKSKKWEE